MNMKLRRGICYPLFVSALLAPRALARAEITTFPAFIARLTDLLNAIAPFIVGLAVFVILWGVFTYLVHAAEEEKREEARRFIVWGVIGVFFMLSIWGFVNVLLGSFELHSTIAPRDIPKVPPLCPPAGTPNPPEGC